MEICLVRHGETDWNKLGKLQGHTDIRLNSKGIIQANACADYLRESSYELIITSPLKRAKQTAQIISERNHIPIIEMSQFIERSYGDAEGLTQEERITKYPDLKYPNQESREFLLERVMLGLQKIQSEQDVKKLILVAHGAVINTILAVISNNEIGSGKTVLANACISTIRFAEGNWHILNYNQVNHLVANEFSP